jgi:hypothetical protein
MGFRLRWPGGLRRLPARRGPLGTGRSRPRWLADRRLVIVSIIGLAYVVLMVGIAAALGPRASPMPDAAATSSPVPVPTPTSSATAAGTAIPTPIAAGPTSTPSSTQTPVPLPCTHDYLLVTCEELRSLPTRGSAWEALKAVADGKLGEAKLSDKDNKHGVRTLAVALVYARTRHPAYHEIGREAVMEAIGTEREGASSSVLALGRQLGSYVLAADLLELSGADDAMFREWLSDIRTLELGGHGRWKALSATHEDSINNWGAFAGASRIAASLYLGDTNDVTRAALVLQGFLGDDYAWSAWQEPTEHAQEWACDFDDVFTPINVPCTRSGIDLDGAIPADISRGGGLTWPPELRGIRYSEETLQGLVLLAALLHQAGYDSWEWSDQALLRAARFIERANGWDTHAVSNHVAWLLNARYSISLPTEPAGFGRLFGYTDWLYGN